MSYLIQFVLGLLNIGLGLLRTDKPVKTTVTGAASLPTKTEDEVLADLGIKTAAHGETGKV